MTLGELIKKARQNAGYTQRELAEKANVATVTLQQYERGVRQPRLEQLHRIADALNVSVAYLEGQESMEVRAIMQAIERKDAREFERLLGLKSGSIVDMNPSLKDDESIITVFAHNDEEASIKVQILEAVDCLNTTGQQEAVKRVEELTEIPKYQRQEPTEPPTTSSEGTDTTPEDRK